MHGIFKRKKSPEQLVKLLKEALDGNLNTEEVKAEPSVEGTDGTDAAVEDPNIDPMTKRLHQIKIMLYGEAGQESNPAKCAQLASLLIDGGLMEALIERLPTLPFEARKHVAQIFNNLIRRDLGNFVPFVEAHPQMMQTLIKGYGHPDIALNCGSMLRETLRHESLTRWVLQSDEFWTFFDIYVHVPNFDIASDAFATLKDILSRHKALTAEFYEKQFDKIFQKYNELLQSENYVTRRQSLKLLGEILLDRANFNTMMRYIGKKENLKMMMNLLRDKSGSIQFEAFHVFKVFVANPKKPTDITQILVNNKEKLIAFLKSFQNDKEDEQFNEEKALLIKTLQGLEIATSGKVVASTTVAK